MGLRWGEKEAGCGMMVVSPSGRTWECVMHVPGLQLSSGEPSHFFRPVERCLNAIPAS